MEKERASGKAKKEIQTKAAVNQTSPMCHFMVNRWGNNGNSDRLYLLGLQNHCSEIKRHLLLGSKAMTNLDSILKSRDITLTTKVFLVVMYGSESWTIKKAEHQRIDAFVKIIPIFPFFFFHNTTLAWTATKGEEILLVCS